MFNDCISHIFNSGACRKIIKKKQYYTAVIECMCIWAYAKSVGVKRIVSEGVISSVFFTTLLTLHCGIRS